MQDGALNDGYSRAYETKMRIAQAFSQLCETQDFDKVTVDAIAKAAGVGRSGFYYHFTDKNAVIEWLSLRFYSAGIDQIGRTLTWFEGHLVTTKGFMQFKPLLMQNSGRSAGFADGRSVFIRHRHETLIETVTQYQHLELTGRLQFQIEALPWTETVMSDKFERGEFNIPLKEFCELMVSIVPNDLYKALEEPVSRKTTLGDFFLL